MGKNYRSLPCIGQHEIFERANLPNMAGRTNKDRRIANRERYKFGFKKLHSSRRFIDYHQRNYF